MLVGDKVLMHRPFLNGSERLTSLEGVVKKVCTKSNRVKVEVILDGKTLMFLVKPKYLVVSPFVEQV